MRRIYFFVEGEDDERFFFRIIKPYFDELSLDMRIIQYAEESMKFRKKFIQSLVRRGEKFLYITDMNNFPCFPKKKERICQKLEIIPKENIMVVVKEIEGWYLAGLTYESSQKLGVDCVGTTNDLIKEQFKNIIPKQYTRPLQNYSFSMKRK